MNVYENKSCMENVYWLCSHTVAVVGFHAHISSHKSNWALIIPTCGTPSGTIIFLNHSYIITLIGVTALLHTIQHIDLLKTVNCCRRKFTTNYLCTTFWVAVSLCAVFINNLWAFLLPGQLLLLIRVSTPQIDLQQQFIMWRFIVCLTTQGQKEGSRLNAFREAVAECCGHCTMQPFTLFLLKTLRSPPHASSLVVKINGCRAQFDKLVVSKLVINAD